MSGLTVTPITAPTITAWQVTTNTAQDAVAAINILVGAGYKAQINVVNSGGAPSWAVTLMPTGAPTLTANDGDWIVVNGTSLSICSDAVFAATYTANVDLVWAPTTTAPVAVAFAGLQATISCTLPTSPNGPWTWTCELTNTTSGELTTETISAAVIANGQVTFTATDLIDTDDYTATITCATQYDGVLATSLPTAPFTAAA